MGVGKFHARRGQRIDIGRGDFSFDIKGTYVPIPQIIRQDIDDVRQSFLFLGCVLFCCVLLPFTGNGKAKKADGQAKQE